jgi:hypothetical protein
VPWLGERGIRRIGYSEASAAAALCAGTSIFLWIGATGAALAGLKRGYSAR